MTQMIEMSAQWKYKPIKVKMITCNCPILLVFSFFKLSPAASGCGGRTQLMVNYNTVHAHCQANRTQVLK